MMFSEGGGTNSALATLVQLEETGPHALFPSFLALEGLDRKEEKHSI